MNPRSRSDKAYLWHGTDRKSAEGIIGGFQQALKWGLGSLAGLGYWGPELEEAWGGGGACIVEVTMPNPSGKEGHRLAMVGNYSGFCMPLWLRRFTLGLRVWGGGEGFLGTSKSALPGSSLAFGALRLKIWGWRLNLPTRSM